MPRAPAIEALRDEVLDDLADGACSHLSLDRIGRALEAATGGPVVIARRDGDALRLGGAPSLELAELLALLARVTDLDRTAARDALCEDDASWRWHGAAGVIAIARRGPTALDADARALLAAAAGLLGAIWRRADADAGLQDALRGTAQLAISQLASRIAHDVNNIVTVIASSSDLLDEAIGADDPARSDLELINDAATRARLLSIHLMMVAQRQPWHAEAIDLGLTLRSQRRPLATELGANVELDLDAAPGLPPVWLDELQLAEALLAISLHLRRVLGHGGRFELRAVAAPEGVELTAVARPKTPTATTASARSAGLAMLAARAVFLRAGGDLIDLGAPEGAATVRGFLPHVPTDDRRPSRVRLLFVAPAEDSELGRSLEELGFDVERATTAAEAALALRRSPELALALTVPSLFADLVAGPRPAAMACFLDDTDDPLHARVVLRGGAARVSRRMPPRTLATTLHALTTPR